MIMFKILQARLQQYVTQHFQMYKLGFEEAEETEIKLPIFIESWRKQGSFRKNICFIEDTKDFDRGDYSKRCG